MVNTNTYKLAFGLGILECASSKRYEEDIFRTVDEKGRPMLLVGEDAFAEYNVEATKKTLEEGRGITWINVVIRK